MRKVYLLEIIFVIWLIILVLLLVPFAVKAEDGEPPMIAFTFDDGPNAVQTSRLLDGLLGEFLFVGRKRICRYGTNQHSRRNHCR